jgi:hypothetical protein
VRVEPAAGLGCNEGPVAAALLQHCRDDLFGPAIAIDVGRINEGDAGIKCGIECTLAVCLADIAPGASDLPGAEADLGNGCAGLAKNSRFHGAVSCFASSIIGCVERFYYDRSDRVN